ncbi:hypothetical protein RMSM_02452 [Rhodopirellula maiorica SM1]|uniref:Uncharacterized protein n=1 Tax=Rhodopirellula maiorica SM1 TaxID=1265738 RepID=M5RMT9_9BACT|nr:hypothetical protein RMSM_02452 [Rhodopirellula maiorica SM1]
MFMSQRAADQRQPRRLAGVFENEVAPAHKKNPVRRTKKSRERIRGILMMGMP